MFAVCRLQHNGPTPRGTLRNFGQNIKKWLSAYKSYNISETQQQQDKTKVTIEV